MNSPKLDLSTTRIFGECDEDIIEAMSLIGQEVYMSDDEDFRDYFKCILVGSRKLKDEHLCYTGISRPKDTCSISFKYFILAEYAVFVEEKEEKKLRPYDTMSEFPFKIGETITYKSKEVDIKIKAMVVGAIEYIESQWPEKDLLSIQFSNKSYSPDELLKYFEYLDPQTKKWKPFGIEE